MKREDINIRDPYVLVYDHKYYLYGTRSDTCWGEAEGFDCYVGETLEEFQGPIEIFHKPEGFFATKYYWAPECYEHRGRFYLITTLGSDDRKKGIYTLCADSPVGPFLPVGERLTPADWTCIDGTLWFEDGTPYLIYSRSFEDQVPEGEYRCVRLSGDLTKAEGEHRLLFTAKDAPWAKPVPFAKQEFGMDGDVYFSDGPSVLELNKKLVMIFSSWSDHGYAVGVAVSESGRLDGEWKLQQEPLFPENGGHGMFFKDLSGDIIFTLHYPNDKYAERPVFYRVEMEDKILKLRTKL